MSLVVSWTALGVVFARPSLADAQACPPLAVEADDDVLALWPELPERIRGTFAARDGIEACARVRLRRSHPAITVEVILADGRSASRTVPQREDVVPVLEALLLVPPADATKASSEPSERAKAPVANASANDVPARAKAPVQAKAPRQRRPTLGVSESGAPDRSPESSEARFGIELSVVTNARIGDGQTSVGLGALSLLDLRGWLLGFEGRADSYNATSEEPQGAFELALLAGHRFRFQNSALDLIVGPAVALQGETTVLTGPAPARLETSSGAVPRLLLASHLTFGTHSVVRTFVGVEGEFGPPGPSLPSDTGVPGGLPGLPAWMVGLALGGTVGTR